MSMKQKIIILLVAVLLAAAAFSIVSADTNSLLQFFGFGKSEQTATPTGSSTSTKSQSTPAPDKDPFADYDPALVDADNQAKSSDSWFDDDWENDPFAYSFSESTYDEVPPETQQKSPYAMPNINQGSSQTYAQNYGTYNEQYMSREDYQRICRNPRIPDS